MKKSSLFSVRLKEERNRIGLTQADMASNCNISREMWGKYERNLALPGSEVLFSLSELGVDIGYLFSGNHSIPLTDDESLLIEAYRESNEQGKDAIERTANALAGKANAPKRSSTTMHINKVEQQNHIDNLTGDLVFKKGK